MPSTRRGWDVGAFVLLLIIGPLAASFLVS
jgi:hypothetical protein